MVSLDVQVAATALLVLRLHLHRVAAWSWSGRSTPATLSFMVLLLTGAALGEWLGRRMLATGVGLFTVASAACAPWRRTPGRFVAVLGHPGRARR